jgi:hypothetical protein
MRGCGARGLVFVLAGLIGLLRGAHLAQLCGRANHSARARPLLLRPALELDAHPVPGVSLAPVVRRQMLKADDEAAAPLPFATPGFPRFGDMKGRPINVSYDGRSFKLNGSHALFLSGSVHPTRWMQGDWDAVLDQAVANGLNMVTIYPFWNFNERTEGAVSFAGRGNYSDFIRRAASRGLFIWLRAGPFVCGEWTSGGLPVWLQQKDGFVFRTNTTVWTSAIRKWMRELVVELRPLFAPQGGPILLAQVENELVETGYFNPTTNRGGDGPYTQFCGALAVELAELGAAVPWGMLPPTVDPSVLELCSGGAACCRSHGLHGRVMRSAPCTFAENEQGFQNWGDSPSKAAWIWGVPISASGASMVEFVMAGGTLHSWYMWAGGSHLGPWGAMGMTTAYATAGLLCPDGLPNEPNFAQSAQLHHTLRDAAQTVLEGWNGSQLHPHAWPATQRTGGAEMTVWRTHYVHAGHSATFIYNNESNVSITAELTYEGVPLTVPAGSVTVLIDGQPRANSATLLTPALHRVYTAVTGLALSWHSWSEPPVAGGAGVAVTAQQPMEQLNLTQGETEFAIYSTRVNTQQLRNGSQLTFVGSCGMAYVIFVDGQRAGEQVNMGGTGGCGQRCANPLAPTGGCGYSGHQTNKVTLRVNSSPVDHGMLTIVAESLGLPTNVPDFGCRRVLRNVTVDSGSVLSGWNMSSGLMGEVLKVYSRLGHSLVPWAPWVPPGTGQAEVEPALTWYTTSFSTPQQGIRANESGLFLNASGLSRGQLYLNGEQLGRVDTQLRNDGSGRPTQGLYPLPTSLLLPSTQLKLLTVVDVAGAIAPSAIAIVRSELRAPAVTWPPDRPATGVTGVADCGLY